MSTAERDEPYEPAEELQNDLPEPGTLPEEEEASSTSAVPDAFRLGGEPPRVMRLSRKALATIGVVASFGIGGSLIYALQPPAHQAPENLYDTNSRNRAETVTGAPTSYGDTPKLGAPLPGDLGRPIVGTDGQAPGAHSQDQAAQHPDRFPTRSPHGHSSLQVKTPADQ